MLSDGAAVALFTALICLDRANEVKFFFDGVLVCVILEFWLVLRESRQKRPREPFNVAELMCLDDLMARVKQRLTAADTVEKPWLYMTVMGADNSLGYEEPCTCEDARRSPLRCESYSSSLTAQHLRPCCGGDSLLSALLHGHGGSGRGSNEQLHMACLGCVRNTVTNRIWRSVFCCGEGVDGAYFKTNGKEKLYSGNTGFSVAVTSSSAIDTSDPRVVNKFIKFCTDCFPAQHRCLIISGHGYGWSPDALLEVSGDSETNKMASFMPIEECDLYFEQAGKGSLRSVLQARGGVDVLGFDSCMGMSLENLYILRSSAKILVGNCDFTGWNGMDHQSIGNALRRGLAHTPWQLACTIVDNFAPQLDDDRNFAVAAYKTEVGSALRSAMCKVAFALLSFIARDPQRHANALLAARQSVRWACYDTGEGGNGGVDRLFADATRLLKALTEASRLSSSSSDRWGVHRSCRRVARLLRCTETSYRHASGSFAGLACINIYFPMTHEAYAERSDLPSQATYESLYAQLTFNTDAMTTRDAASWSHFLDVLFKSAASPTSLSNSQ
jgi:hypothetical protein